MSQVSHRLENAYAGPAELHCSPKAHKFAEKDKTCFSHGELKLLAREFNKKAGPSVPKITGRSKKELTGKLLTAYKHICDKHQFCWIKQTLSDPKKAAKLEAAFRPSRPLSWESDRNTWLNTYDILYVLEQYEDLYKDYVFLGVYPIDFASKDSFGTCVGTPILVNDEKKVTKSFSMCNFDIKRDVLDKKKKRFGIVFNTDPSNRGGAHWYGMYCSLDTRRSNPNFGVYTYDSVANSPQKEVSAFMKRIAEQVDALKGDVPSLGKRTFQSKYNKTQKQFGNNECGVFSLAYQTQMLKNIPFEKVCTRMKNDSYMNKLRDVFYRPNLRPRTA